MRVQFLASGSRGNAALLWAGETVTLLDAGVSIRKLSEKLVEARIGHRALDHVVVSHGHLDHSRSAGILAKRHGATLHCAAKIQLHRSVARAPDKRDLPIGGATTLDGRTPADSVSVRTVRIPHDCDPTVAFRIEHDGRVLGLISDMGEPREDAATLVRGAHVLAIEANHDPKMLASGPYPATLKQRITGTGGHLSNDQMATMLTRIAGEELHTVVLLHLSAHNNTKELAQSAAQRALATAGYDGVRVLVAEQNDPLSVIEV